MGLVFESWLLDVVLLVGLAVFYLRARLADRYRYFEKKGVPFVEPAFILGNTYRAFLGKETMFESLDKIYKRMKGKRFCGFFTFLKPTLMIRDPSIIHKVFIEEFTSFEDNGLASFASFSPLGDGLLFLTGDKWRCVRRKLVPVFTSGKLRAMVPIVDKCVSNLLDAVNPGVDFELGEINSLFSIDVIGSCAFGLELNSQRDPNGQFITMCRKSFQGVSLRSLRIGLSLVSPWLYKKLNMKPTSEEEEVSNFFLGFVKTEFERRKATGAVRKDFLQRLLELREKGEVAMERLDAADEEEANELHKLSYKENLVMTDQLLAAQAFLFFGAGFTSLTSTMSYILFALATNQEIQNRTRQEVQNVLAHSGELNYEAVSKMTYLNAVISETTRFYPINQSLMRVCTKPMVIEGLKIDQGALVSIPTYSIHMDPDIYEDPDVFRPERFLQEGFPPKETYLPFGDGPRMCIAKRFALLVMKLAVARILLKYRVLPSSKTQLPLRYQAFGSVLVYTPVGGLWVTLADLPDETPIDLSL